MLQLEKEIRTRVEALVLEKSQRVQQLKALMEQDHDLCDILCSMPYRVNEDSVPSLEQLEGFREHVTNQMAEKVGITKPLVRMNLFIYFTFRQCQERYIGGRNLYLS